MHGAFFLRGVTFCDRETPLFRPEPKSFCAKMNLGLKQAIFIRLLTL
jgi:hypothetical protein